jgi:hypothetical protein
MLSNRIAPLAGRMKSIGIGAAVVVSVITLGAGIGEAYSSKLEDELEIAKLSLCYARGTDAIGAGKLQLGKKTYEDCFTSDAHLALWNPGTPFNGPPDYQTNDTDDWAEYAQDVFQGAGYVATQHLVSNIEVDVKGNTATMKTYLLATHVLPDGTYDVANGTYEDVVVRQWGKWQIKNRTLKLITFTNAGTPTTP